MEIAARAAKITVAQPMESHLIHDTAIQDAKVAPNEKRNKVRKVSGSISDIVNPFYLSRLTGNQGVESVGFFRRGANSLDVPPESQGFAVAFKRQLKRLYLVWIAPSSIKRFASLVSQPTADPPTHEHG